MAIDTFSPGNAQASAVGSAVEFDTHPQFLIRNC